MSQILLEESGSSAGSIAGMVVWLVVIVVIFYFLLIRPQRRDQKKKDAMIGDLEVGDTVLTTSGFYGNVIDVQDDTIIVEFGNNRNCRIPMQKAAIADVEKPEESVQEKPDDTKKGDAKEKDKDAKEKESKGKGTAEKETKGRKNQRQA